MSIAALFSGILSGIDRWSRGALLHLVPVPYVALVVAGFFVEPGLAEQRELKSDAAEQIDAVLVMDASGSMLLTDPKRLRDEGARLFAQFLKSGDRLAVVQFAEEAKVVRPLSPFSSDQLPDLSQKITEIGATGQYTDILAGVKLAGEILAASPNPEARSIIVLLSDGKMDPDPAKGAASAFSEKLLGEVVPGLKTKNIRSYTLAFSEEADKSLLSQIAAAGDGVSWYTPASDKIHESFASLFLSVKKPQVIPLSGKGFSIDADVEEATFYISREGGSEVSIQTPGGKSIKPETPEPNVQWFRGQKFDVITISRPEIGRWQVIGISPQEGFATILTNLKLVTDWPLSVEADVRELLQARLYEGKKPIELPEMSGVIRYAFQITPTDRVAEPIIRDFLGDDGNHGDVIARDGIFSYAVKIAEAGEYHLRIIAKAPTFERQQLIPFRVKPALVALKIVQPKTPEDAEKHVEGEKDQEHETKQQLTPAPPDGEIEKIAQGGAGTILRAELSDEAKQLKGIQVKITAVDARRFRYVLPASPSLENPLYFEVSAAALPNDGRYDLQVTLTADLKGKQVRENSRTVSFVKVTAGEEAPEETAVVVVEPPKEEKPSWFPLWGVLIASIVILGAGGFAIVAMRKAQGSMTMEVQEFKIPEALLKGIEALEQKVALVEIDLNSPLFMEDAAAPAVEQEAKELPQEAPATTTGGVTPEAPQPPPAGAETPAEAPAPSPETPAPGGGEPTS